MDGTTGRKDRFVCPMCGCDTFLHTHLNHDVVTYFVSAWIEDGGWLSTEIEGTFKDHGADESDEDPYVECAECGAEIALDGTRFRRSPGGKEARP